MPLPELVQPTIWRLRIRLYWGGWRSFDIFDSCSPEEALQAYERQFRCSCQRIGRIEYFCPVDKVWKELTSQQVQAAIVLAGGVS